MLTQTQTRSEDEEARDKERQRHEREVVERVEVGSTGISVGGELTSDLELLFHRRSAVKLYNLHRSELAESREEFLLVDDAAVGRLRNRRDIGRWW